MVAARLLLSCFVALMSGGDGSVICVLCRMAVFGGTMAAVFPVYFAKFVVGNEFVARKVMSLA
jgi:hypothetical protein